MDDPGDRTEEHDFNLIIDGKRHARVAYKILDES